jgi:hypothetical protein
MLRIRPKKLGISTIGMLNTNLKSEEIVNPCHEAKCNLSTDHLVR